jgi:hypothetical protein
MCILCVCAYVCMCARVHRLGYEVKMHFICQAMFKLRSKAIALHYTALHLLCLLTGLEIGKVRGVKRKEHALLTLQGDRFLF